MEFPRYMFRSPGLYIRPGGSYDSRIAESAQDRDALVAAGWHDTVDAAADAEATAKPAKAAK